MSKRSHKADLSGAKRGLVVGTKAVLERGPGDFRVVCATCDGGGGTPYRTREAAGARATASSANACRLCGAS